MKIAAKFAIFATAFCILAAAVWIGLYIGHRNHTPASAGRSLEFRLVAVSPHGLGQPSAQVSGADAFSSDEANKFINSGDAPAGWTWLPIVDPAAKNIEDNSSGTFETEDIVRTSGARIYLMVADRPDMTLTHGAGTPAWGVETVRLNLSEDFGPAVEITLDDAGGKRMREFSQKYIGHSLAVSIGGQVCMIATIETPLGNALEVRFPVGQRAEAESLRDTLMK